MTRARMQIAEVPFLSDWLVISLRWLVLLGMVVRVALAGTLNITMLAALLFASFWNIIVTLLAVLNRRIPGHRGVSIAIDWAVALVIFGGTGGMNGPVLWAGLLALLSSAVYYGMKGSLLTAGLMLCVQVLWSWHYLWKLSGLPSPFDLPVEPVWRGALAVAGANLLLGGVVGFFSKRLSRAVLRTHLAHEAAQMENERRAQRNEHERMQAFYRLLERLGATLDHQVVLDTALELAATALGDSRSPVGQMVGMVLLLDDSEGRAGRQGALRVGAGRLLSAGDLRLSFPAARGTLNAVVQTGEARHFLEPAQDPELERVVALQGCRSALALPLRRGLSAFGLMLFAHPDADFFNPDRSEVLEVISHQAVIAIQNARLYQEVQHEKEYILETQDEARKKLARDLHDGPTQSVSAIAMGLSITRRILARGTDDIDGELERLEELARRTAQEIRHMLFTLRPLILETEGLAAALEAMADKMRDTFQQNVLVEADRNVETQMDTGKQTVVFYLAEEAVTNARKHARASLVTVRLGLLPKEPDLALLEVVDNGSGFEVDSMMNTYSRRGSLGMVNLRERTKLINGVLNIDSMPGRGTCVSVLVPLTDAAAERIQRGTIGGNGGQTANGFNGWASLYPNQPEDKNLTK